MATFNLRGFRFVDKPFRPDAFFKVNVQFVVSDDFTFSYAISGSNANNLGVTLNSTNGDIYAIRQGGTKDLTQGYELTAERLVTSGGAASTFFVFSKELRPGVTEKIYVQISGSEVPDFTSASAFRNWTADRSLTQFPANDPLGPNTTLAVSDLVANGSRLGEDVITLDVDWDDDLVSTGGGDDSVTGNARANRMDLGFGDDTASGAGGNDTILGGLGADSLMGAAGNDSLNGGFGRDILMGGDGDDILTGGARADRFVFAVNAGSDRITDFRNDVDILDLRAFNLTETQLTPRLAQLGDNVVITLSDTQSITVEKITVSALMDDILF